MDLRQIRQNLGERDSPQVIKIRQRATDAVRTFEKLPGYPRIHLDAMKKGKAEYNATGKQLPEPLIPNPERLDYEVKILDIWAAAYLHFVSDLETHKLFLDIMRGLAQNAWERYRGISPIMPNKNNPGAEKIGERTVYWEEESWNRLVALEDSPEANIESESQSKRGYSAEVKAWMKDHGVSSVEAAAKRLGVGYDTLKSIMSEKGTPRYSPETLKSVLEKITSVTGE